MTRGDGGTPSVSGGRYTPLPPPPEGEARRAGAVRVRDGCRAGAVLGYPFRQPPRGGSAAATSALRCPKNAAHIRLLAFFVLPPFVRFADISPAGGIFRCGNSGFASERLAAFAVGGPVSRRPANGAAAEIPVTLHLPPAARNRNPATGSAKPQFPRRGRQAGGLAMTGGTGAAGDQWSPLRRRRALYKRKHRKGGGPYGIFHFGASYSSSSVRSQRSTQHTLARKSRSAIWMHSER